MKDIIEVHNNFKDVDIKFRSVKDGNEFLLVREFIDHRKNQFKQSDSKKLAVFIEPMINSCYPDIVFVEYKPNIYEKWNSSRSLLDKEDYKILFHIKDKHCRSIEDIVSKLGFNWNQATKSIEKLIDAKIIFRKSKRWVVESNNIFGVTKIEAIEAKMSFNETLIHQALINSTFASESYVLTNFQNELSLEKTEKLDYFGIGLYNQCNHKFKKVSNAAKNKLPVSYSSIYFNEWIGKILVSS